MSLSPAVTKAVIRATTGRRRHGVVGAVVTGERERERDYIEGRVQAVGNRDRDCTEDRVYRAIGDRAVVLAGNTYISNLVSNALHVQRGQKRGTNGKEQSEWH